MNERPYVVEYRRLKRLHWLGDAVSIASHTLGAAMIAQCAVNLWVMFRGGVFLWAGHVLVWTLIAGQWACIFLLRRLRRAFDASAARLDIWLKEWEAKCK